MPRNLSDGCDDGARRRRKRLACGCLGSCACMKKMKKSRRSPKCSMPKRRKTTKRRRRRSSPYMRRLSFGRRMYSPFQIASAKKSCDDRDIFTCETDPNCELDASKSRCKGKARLAETGLFYGPALPNLNLPPVPSSSGSMTYDEMKAAGLLPKEDGKGRRKASKSRRRKVSKKSKKSKRSKKSKKSKRSKKSKKSKKSRMGRKY